MHQRDTDFLSENDDIYDYVDDNQKVNDSQQEAYVTALTSSATSYLNSREKFMKNQTTSWAYQTDVEAVCDAGRQQHPMPRHAYGFHVHQDAVLSNVC